MFVGVRRCVKLAAPCRRRDSNPRHADYDSRKVSLHRRSFCRMLSVLPELLSLVHRPVRCCPRPRNGEGRLTTLAP
jgi:hypothetical protein